MKKAELAIFGGAPEIKSPLKPYCVIGEEERLAVDAVMRGGILSGYVGAWCDAFDGGPKVREFESRWAETFRCAYAVAVNSNTSGLVAAMGAIGLCPGDEVIVPPNTMSATAMAPIVYGGVPVFVDVEDETFCLDVEKVSAAITSRTKAILAVNLFGHPARLTELRRIADENGIYLVEDNAQGPLASEDARYAGTIGHIGVFSLNYHKHIHTGEGGVCTTDNERLSRRLRMIRNHAENVTNELAGGELTNLIGFNFRLTEIQAAIGLAQLQKVNRLVSARKEIAEELSRRLGVLPGVIAPKVRPGCNHVYYVWSARIDAEKTGVPRNILARALAAEGVPVSVGYVEPLYMLPVFQNKIAIGSSGWPFTLSNRSYHKGLCPISERLYEEELLEVHVCSYSLDRRELDSVIAAFEKVFEARDSLMQLLQV